MRKSLIVLTLAFGLIGQGAAFGQHAVSSSALGNGSTAASNSLYSISGTLGQSAIGTASTASTFHQSGFWFTTSAGPIAVWAPDTTAAYASQIKIPIYASDTSASNIVAAEVFLSYDRNLLTAQSVDATNTLLSANWSVEHNIVAGVGSSIDTVKIAMATDDDALTGTGALIFVDFSIADTRQPTSSPLTLAHVLFNDGAPENSRTHGSLTIIGANGTIANNPSTIIPRETIAITVVDSDEDSDGVPGTD